MQFETIKNHIPEKNKNLAQFYKKIGKVRVKNFILEKPKKALPEAMPFFVKSNDK